jgi:hypothetical protein
MGKNETNRRLLERLFSTSEWAFLVEYKRFAAVISGADTPEQIARAVSFGLDLLKSDGTVRSRWRPAQKGGGSPETSLRSGVNTGSRISRVAATQYGTGFMVSVRYARGGRSGKFVGLEDVVAEIVDIIRQEDHSQNSVVLDAPEWLAAEVRLHGHRV